MSGDQDDGPVCRICGEPGTTLCDPAEEEDS